MQPRLDVTTGPLQGRTFEITQKGILLGRDVTCDLNIAGPEISRRHCEIRSDDQGAFVLRDLNSRHGTLLNGRPIREQTLRHSDVLDLGGSRLIFLLDESSDGADTSFPTPPSLSTHLARRLTESVYFSSDPQDTVGVDPKHFARDLQVLLRLSGALQESRDLETLADRLLEACFTATPARRGAVLLYEPGVEDPQTLTEKGDPLLSQTVLDRVLGEGIALLAPNLLDDTELADAVSLSEVSAVLAAPLLDHEGEALGAVYLDRDQRGFTEHHLELLTALAAIASIAFQNVLHLRWLTSENERLRGDVATPGNMIGRSSAMLKVFDLVKRVARADSTVLIHGESGTGKELIAQAIHRASPRSRGPFVAVNCATLTENLLESELFGHERGAFTGAQARKIGKMEVAQRGTLFLDEIAEIPIGLQAKILRALQEREIERVGGERPIKIDVRVLAASHRDLGEAVREGRFREDLYYRLRVIPIELPPLRDRREDIPLLASFFAAKHALHMGFEEIGISPEARQCLLEWAWPGNVRELSNAVERAVVLGDGKVLRREDLPDEIAGAAIVAAQGRSQPATEKATRDFQESLVAYKKVLILDAWQAAGKEYATTAKLLGIHVNSLHRMIRQLDLKEAISQQ